MLGSAASAPAFSDFVLMGAGESSSDRDGDDDAADHDGSPQVGTWAPRRHTREGDGGAVPRAIRR
jgi:hypothetical protein